VLKVTHFAFHHDAAMHNEISMTRVHLGNRHDWYVKQFMRPRDGRTAIQWHDDTR